PTASSLCQPMQAAVDGAGNLWVADYGSSRVLMFPPGSTTATRVLGTDGSFTVGEPPLSRYPGPGDSCNLQRGEGSAGADTLREPESVSLDPAGDLIVADTFNNRVLEWSAATLAHFGPGACAFSCFIPATHVWGQYANFEMNDPNNPNIPPAYTAACPAPARA